MRVLVVDDSPDVFLLCRLTLEREGWAVSGAADGRAGVDAVDRESPDVVLLDMMMPDYDGFFFLDQLRRRADGDEPPVVVLSA
ncbi:MAG TPA: response regulator, partial [Acidimicrobiales bacterium]